MSRAGAFLVALGLAFIATAVAVSTFDRILAIGCVVIGAFLIILPSTESTSRTSGRSV